MELESLFNLPAHPLLVHVPVVCIPLAALGALAITARPSWRRTYGPLVLLLALVGALGAILAAGSGESLQEARRIRDLGDHGDLGEMARNVSLLLVAVVGALVVVDRAHEPRLAGRAPWLARRQAQIQKIVAVLTVLVALGATWATVAAGHSGAERVWKDDTASVER